MATKTILTNRTDARNMITALKAVKSDFCFIHLTPYSNLDSIKNSGAIYSFAQLQRRLIIPEYLSNVESRNLDKYKNLQGYVRLAMTKYSALFPAFYKRSKKFAMLYIKPEILLERDFLVCPINAATSGAVAGSFADIKDRLDLATILNLSSYPSYYSGYFHRSQAEVLIDGDIPYEFIKKIDIITK